MGLAKVGSPGHPTRRGRRLRGRHSRSMPGNGRYWLPCGCCDHRRSSRKWGRLLGSRNLGQQEKVEVALLWKERRVGRGHFRSRLRSRKIRWRREELGHTRLELCAVLVVEAIKPPRFLQ
jgi:hypothetical protein